MRPVPTNTRPKPCNNPHTTFIIHEQRTSKHPFHVSYAYHQSYVRVSYVLEHFKKYPKLCEQLRQRMVNTRYGTARNTSRFTLTSARGREVEKSFIPLEQVFEIFEKMLTNMPQQEETHDAKS